MGAVPSTPRPPETAEYLIGTFVGEKSLPLTSDFWPKLLELPINLQWPSHRVRQACDIFLQNNYYTRHLAKILIYLASCVQESISAPSTLPTVYTKAVNSVHISSIFLKHLIENSRSGKFDELYLSLDGSEPIPSKFPRDQNIEHLVMRTVLSFIGSAEVSSATCLLHHELLNFMLVAMSTQLLCGPSPGPKDVNPFTDAAMAQDSSLVGIAVHKLLLNYMAHSHISFKKALYTVFSEGSQPNVLQRVGFAAANFMLLPFNYLVSSSVEGLRSQLANSSLLVLLVLIHYRKCAVNNGNSDSLVKEFIYFSENPYCKALENARDVEFDRIDIEGNAHNDSSVRLPFASLFDSLGICLADDTAVLLLYSLVHGNSDFLEYVLVRTDLDTLLMPILETLYNASKKTSNQIYMLLTLLLILSQDSSFNASIHKLVLPSVPWYQERRLHQTSLGSLMVIILIRIVKYNLSKLRDLFLHTNCLAVLANMAPHVHQLSAYASQRLVSLFDMLSRKYTKLAELRDDKMGVANVNSLESTESHIYADFLRIVLEMLNAILSYALPQNPEVIYAIMHRQEVFHPFKNHPRFYELLENIYTVLDFFNSRLDAQRMNGEPSVDKVLQVIISNCRSWRGEGMKMFTQLRFTYEQESHPEEFFIPYVWQLVLSSCGFDFHPSTINLFSIDLPIGDDSAGEEDVKQHPNEWLNEQAEDLNP